MIAINYGNEIKINTGDLTKSFSTEQLPLNIEIRRSISNDIVWTVQLDSNMWGSFPQVELNDVLVYDAQNKLVLRYRWDVIDHGSTFHKSLWLFCKSIINQGRTPKGLAIGTHDGDFGEWVPLTQSSLSDIVLVEGSNPQFNKLKNNFLGYRNLKFLNQLVTTDGKDVIFFEGGRGYTNSVVERVIRGWETEEINSSMRSSISLNDLIRNELNGQIDWLHLDVEGLDAKLIMSMDETYKLPKLIIFEHENLELNEKYDVFSWLESRKYTLHSEGGITMATNLLI